MQKIKKSIYKKTQSPKKEEKINTFSLKDLIESVGWEPISGMHKKYTALADDEVKIGFFGRQKEECVNAELVKIRLGVDVCSKLGWQAKDKIVIMHNPDDYLSFLLAKCETGAGRILSAELKSPHFRIVSRWKRPISINCMPYKTIQYKIYKNYLYFRVEA